MTLTSFLHGVSVWAPRLPGWAVAAPVLRGEAEAPGQPAARPAPTLLAPTERRRAPDTVAIALEVAARACENAGLDPRSLPNIFASTHGDLAISDYMCETLAKTPALISPIRFHNSVHNAAAGYWSIGTGCMKPSTALTGGADTFGEGLLETLVQAHADECPALLVAYDIEARGPLVQMQPSRGNVGVGLIVGPQPGAAPLARLNWRMAGGTSRSEASARNASLVEGNALAACMPFLEAVALRRPTTVRLGLSPTQLLEVELDFTGSA